MPEKPAKKPSKKKLTDEEKRAKKLEKQQKLLREHLERELKFSELSQNRNEETHFKVAENIRINQVLTELTAQVQFTNHLKDKAENAIETVKIHREHAGEQHLRIQMIQSDLIKYMTDLFQLFQDSLSNMYEMERKSLIDDFFDETVNRERILNEQKTYYENYAHATVSLLNSRFESAKENFIDNRIDIEAGTVIKNEEMTKKKLNFELKICTEIEEIFKGFGQCWPKHRLEEYKTALEEDEKILSETEDVMTRIKESRQDVEDLKKAVTKSNKETELKISELKNEHKSLLLLFRGKKLKLKEEFDKEHVKLKALIKASAKAQKCLNRTVDILNRIALALKLCAKHERIDDRIFLDEKLESFDQKLSDESLNFDALENLKPKGCRNYIRNIKCRSIIDESCLSDQKFVENFTETDEILTESSIKLEGNFSLEMFGRDYNYKNPWNQENFEYFSSDSPQFEEISSQYSSSLSLTQTTNEQILNKFYKKLARVEAECLMIKNYKQQLISDNESLESSISNRKHENGINQNMNILRLNRSKSIGKIGQISHQMSQIHDEILTRKCKKAHMKHKIYKSY